MHSGLKQRLIGAAVLVALAVIFLPMLVQGPAPDSGVSDLPLQMPDAPGGEYQTRDLPLVTPGASSADGVLRDDDALPTVDTASAPPASETDPIDEGADERAASAPEELPARPATAAEMLPAATAGGHYAVSFGAYGSRANADTVVAGLRASQLSGYRETATVDGRNVWRVRIGPYATRAEAEAARLRAAHVRDDLDARVIALDAEAAQTGKPATQTATAPVPKPVEPVPTAAAAPKPAAAAGVGFAVQLGAFSKPADAVALRDRLRAGGLNAFTETVDTDKGALTRVKAGPVLSRAEADQLKAQVQTKFGIDGLVRSHP